MVDLKKKLFVYFFLLRFTTFRFYFLYQEPPEAAKPSLLSKGVYTNYYQLFMLDSWLVDQRRKKEGQNRRFYCCGFRPRPDVELFWRRTISVDLLSTTGT